MFLKGRVVSPRTSVSHQLIEDLQEKAFTVSQACRLLEINRSSLYAAAKRRYKAPVLCTDNVRL